MSSDGGAPEAAVEPPDEEGLPHFAETDPSQRFGRFDQVLGRGAFKVVYKAFDTQEGTEVAWNQVRVSELMSTKDAENKEERDRLFAEIRVLKALKHKNIMSFYDSWYDARTYTVNFITELFTSGTLRQYRKRHKHIDEEVLKRWAWQILCGLVYLHGHSPPIIHRDLKCDNIFINGSDGVVKIGDLGLATMLRSRTAPQSVLGTPEFMAPELYEEEYDDRVDVYSFGMCLLELSTMEYPYAECKNAAQIYRKVSLGVRPAGLQKVVSPELAEFINVCISPRETRPRARQLLKHPYFDSIRKDKLLTSRSDAALASHTGGGDGVSEYGSLASGPVSRTASSLNELVAAVASGGQLSGAVTPQLQGPPSASSVGGGALAAHPLSRTVSSDAHSDRAASDTASVRSQRSNASELAMAVLENIAEEGESTENGEESNAASPAVRSQQASKQASPRSSPPPATSPTKPGSPTSSDGCRCDATERRFSVKGDWQGGDNRVQLRLRICEPTGATRTVEFEFELGVDTAADVAGEMVTDLELTPEDAAVISATIKGELDRMSALPQMDPQMSICLSMAAQVLQHEVTTKALEQANSGASARELGLGSREPSLLPNGLRQLGRFSEQTSVLPSPEVPPMAAMLAAAMAAAQPSTPPSTPPPDGQQQVHPPTQPQVQQTAQQLPSLPPLPRSGASTSSLLSFSSASASSIPTLAYGGVLAPPLPAGDAAQQAVAAAVLAAHPPTLAHVSPPPRAAPLPPFASEAQPPVRPMSPLGNGDSLPPPGAAPDVPSPSQRVMRTNSVDAMSLLSRTSSLPPGREREPAASPLGVGSGALSPTSGILSPSASVHEKRVPLGKLFENLGEYIAQQRTDSPRLEAAMAAVANSSSNGSIGGATSNGPLPPSLPPLPHPSARPLQSSSSSSGSVLDGSAPGSGDMSAAMLRPRSEACLTALAPGLGRLSPGLVVAPCAPASAPLATGGLAAAVALAEQTPTLASPSSASSNVSPRSTASCQAAVAATVVATATADAMQRLDLQSSALVPLVTLPPPPPPGVGRVGAHVLSAPASKVPSRDGSPTREGSLSPTRCSADASVQLNGKRQPVKDKEALRRQAADAMKAVELRSLNLLEGGLGASKVGATRGVPMAAVKSMTSLCSVAAPTLVQPPPASFASLQTPPQKQQQQPPSQAANGIAAVPSVAAHQQLPPAAAAAAATIRAPTASLAMQAAPLVPPHSSSG